VSTRLRQEAVVPGARISLDGWKAAGRTVSYRDYSIFLREAGSREAESLLLIHGFPTASWDWEAMWLALAERFHVVALDMIGFGFSAKPRSYRYSILDQADLIESVLAREGIRSYHVLAHDYGDSVAQELIARRDGTSERPELRSVAFLNGGLFPETHRPALIQRLLLSPAGPWISRLASRSNLARNMRRIFGSSTQPDDELIDAFWSLITANEGRHVMHKLIRYMPERRIYRARWVGALQHTRIPLKLIDGAADPISGAHMAARYRELVPEADVTLLEQVGHYPQVEVPAAVLDAYLEFRRRHGATSPV
jgi:pimeloyl-ACP methyl ester carboxylesterase